MKLRNEIIPASEIYNACAPHLVWPVVKHLGESFFDEENRELVEQVGRWYVDLFDEKTGHYTNLRESIERDGIQHRIAITAGKSQRREDRWLPPELRGVETLICEKVGGSRLFIAQEMGLDVPCLVNDYVGWFSSPELNKNKYQSVGADYFEEKPKGFIHMPLEYDFKQQQTARREVWAEILQRVKLFLEKRREINDA